LDAGQGKKEIEEIGVIEIEVIPKLALKPAAHISTG
jgi:hypothetical protein